MSSQDEQNPDNSGSAHSTSNEPKQTPETWIVKAKIPKTPAEREDKKSRKQLNDRIKKATLIFVGAYTFITTLIWCTSRDTEHQQLRAYVGLHRGDKPEELTIDVNCVSCLTSPPGRPMAAGYGFSEDYFTFSLKNFGTSPAYRPFSCLDVVSVPPEVIEIPNAKGLAAIKKCLDKSAYTTPTIFPSEVRVIKQGMSKEMVDAIWRSRTQQEGALVVGAVTYYDIFGALHHTYICYEYLYQVDAANNRTVKGVRSCNGVMKADD